MKKIISAIDFSKCSLHALEYAINLANHDEADIIMVWVDRESQGEPEFGIPEREQRSDIKRQLDELVERYQPALKTGKLSFKIRKGKVYREIANQARYEDASLVIAGSHGITGFEKFWVGSNAYRIVSYSPCPVITLRLSFGLKEGIKKIVFPIDSTSETWQKAPFTARMARIFGSEIHIVAIYSSSLSVIRRRVDANAQQIAEFMHSHGVKFQAEAFETESVSSDIISFAERINADLISIMTEQDTTASNILLGHYAQQLINHSPIPVMTIQSKEIMKMHNPAE